MIKQIVVLIAISLFVGCGSSSNKSRDTREASLDMRDYFPLVSVQKTYLETFNSPTNTRTETPIEDILIEHNRLTYRSPKDDTLFKTITIEDNALIDESKAYNFKKHTLNRFVRVGDEVISFNFTTPIEDIVYQEVIFGKISKETEKRCILKDKISDFTIDNLTFFGDILKFECITTTAEVTKMKEDAPILAEYRDGRFETDYDISYFYMQKDKGFIAFINEDCLVKREDTLLIKDNIRDDRECTKAIYHKLLISSNSN